MNKQFKSKSELFYYLMHGYMYMLEDVPTKNGIQKRLKDNELEQSLKEQIIVKEKTNKRTTKDRWLRSRIETWACL